MALQKAAFFTFQIQIWQIYREESECVKNKKCNTIAIKMLPPGAVGSCKQTARLEQPDSTANGASVNKMLYIILMHILMHVELDFPNCEGFSCLFSVTKRKIHP